MGLSQSEEAGAIAANCGRLDLRTEAARELLLEVSPEVVVHCAAVLPSQHEGQGAVEAARANRAMDRRVIEYCAAARCRLVFLSSMSVYGLQNADLMGEETKLDPVGPYAAGKAESEEDVRKLDSAAILRVSSPFGRGQRENVLSLFVANAMRGEPLRYYGSGSRCQDFVAARDVGRAIVAAAAARVSGTFNIASGEPIAMKELAELVVRELGSKSSVEAAGRDDPQEGFGAAYAISKAEAELGWRPEVPLAEGIRGIGGVILHAVMKIGFISDAHGNSEGLRACLEVLRRRERVEEIYFLGDAVGYLPDFAGVIGILREGGIVCLKGNHDAMLVGELDLDGDKDRVYRIGRVRELVSEEDRDFLQSRAPRLELTAGGRRLCLFHGSPWDPLNGYVYPDSDLTPFADLECAAVMMGHTHRPFVGHAKQTLVVNVGILWTAEGSREAWHPARSTIRWNTKPGSSGFLSIRRQCPSAFGGKFMNR